MISMEQETDLTGLTPPQKDICNLIEKELISRFHVSCRCEKVENSEGLVSFSINGQILFYIRFFWDERLQRLDKESTSDNIMYISNFSINSFINAMTWEVKTQREEILKRFRQLNDNLDRYSFLLEGD